MDFRLLGPLEVVANGRPVALGGAKQRSLLALLLLHANELVTRDRLIDELWGDRPPGTADHTLDVQVSRLRKALGPEELIVTQTPGYVLRVAAESIDVRRFEQLLAQARSANAAGRADKALEALERADELWRGPPLADVAYESFARSEIERLEELRLVATEERIDAQLALARHGEVVAEAERLARQYPLRERLHAQLMLALYRSGRQAEALRVYADTRSRLVSELGIEPGTALRELEQAILRQDPALDLARTRLRARRRRRALAGALAVLLAGVAVAAIVGLTQGSTGSARAVAEADSNVILAARTGKLIRAAPVRETELLRFDGDALWSVSEDGEVTRLDAKTAKTVATIGLGIEPAGLAVGGGSVWATGEHSSTLFRIDPSVNKVVDEFALPMDQVETDETGEVAVGAGSVWIGHGAFNPGAWVERLDPVTGRLQHRFSILAGDVDHLAFGEGGLWVASSPGEIRKIDPRTNKVLFMRKLQAQLCCIAVGGGYAWAASNPDGVVWKVSGDGTVLPTIDLGAPVEQLTFADGALWATLGEEGTAVRIDPATGARRRYHIGHAVTGIDVHGGLVAVGVQQSVEDELAGRLEGDVVWVGRKAGTIFDSGAATDPAFTGPGWDSPQQQFHYATCARLFNYRDVEGDEGRRPLPEVAEGLPRVSDLGRTYTFKIRKGFGFSPPSEQEVTAESFRHAIERIASPKFDYVPPSIENIVGATDYHRGGSRHISGISARGNTLVIRFYQPHPEMPWLAALSCAVAVPTPVVRNGLDTPVPSAGPYYLAEHTKSYAVLKRNPNYGGSRPQHVDAIVFRFNVPPGLAAAQIAKGKLDYFLESQNATLTPVTAAARSARGRYRLTPDASSSTAFLAFNTGRRLFSDISMRRAVQYALDRRELAAADPAGAVPATRLLHPKLPGFTAAPVYPLSGDVRMARKLAAGRQGPVVVFAPEEPPYTDAFNRALREQLAAIGLKMTILPMRQQASPEEWLATARRADLITAGINAQTGDPAAYLQLLYLPTQAQRDELQRLAKLSTPQRERASVALARKIERQSLFAVFRYSAVPEFVSRRLGCIVHQPEYPGVDLAALCLP